MIQNVLRALGNVEIYGVISICLFFIVFLAALLFAVTRSKRFCQSMSTLPLDSENQVDRISAYEK